MLGGRWLAQKGAVKRDELRWGRSLIIAAAMMGLVLVVSIVMIHHINQTERERCFEHLYREASDLAAYIEGQMAADRESLELLAAVVARSEDLAAPALWQTISSFEQVGSGTVWAVDVSDVSAAASWAVAMGIRPIAPEPLVAAWRGILEGVTHDVG